MKKIKIFFGNASLISVHLSTRLLTENSAGQTPSGITLLEEAFHINRDLPSTYIIMLIQKIKRIVQSIFFCFLVSFHRFTKAFKYLPHHLTGVTIITLISSSFLGLPSSAIAYSAAQKNSFQKSILDYRQKLNPKFKKIIRKKTKYIIIHTSEANLKTTLKIVTHGKKRKGKLFTYGGHAHYVIAGDGRTFRILDKKFRADHAGRSMWNGETDISSVSIGIELVGYHNHNISDQQYRSVGILIDILQQVYDLKDIAVLTHSQVAYGNPHRWVHRKHRGRKFCAVNLNRSKAGLKFAWSFDPDVKAGRLLADSYLAAVYYKKTNNASHQPTFNIVTINKTAWSIAGKHYNKKSTIYFLPSGRIMAGNQISDWSDLPADTKLIVGYCGPFKVTGSKPPIKIAGSNYNDKRTLYYFPNKQLVAGDKVKNFKRLPHNVIMFLPVKSFSKL